MAIPARIVRVKPATANRTPRTYRMFYTRPVLNFESQYREPDDSATVPLGEIMRSQTAADLAAGQIGSRSLNLTSVYDDHNAKVKGLMGVDLPNPAKQTFGYFADPAEKDR